MVLRNSSGFALVLALLAISFLVAVTVELSTSVNRQMQTAANQGRIVQLDAMLSSGLHLAQAALLADQQKNDYDSAFDDWGSLDSEFLNSLFGEDRLEITVTDLSGLLQVNALQQTGEGTKKKDFLQVQRELWMRLLLSGNYAVEDEDQARELLDSLMDWLDTDDQERENGAEKGYYSGRNPAYAPADGPMLFADELLLVRGWSRNLLYGDKEHTGIIDYLTVAGEGGKININTAPLPVLKTLSPEMNDELATGLIDFRREERNREFLAQPDWYRRVDGFPGDVTLEKDVITTSSSVFMVTVTAQINSMKRQGRGVLQRMENREQRLLSWKVE